MANLEDGVQLTNAAYVQSEKRDPVPDNNLSDATVAVVAYFADLRLFKTGPMTATAGDLLNYSLLIVNDGPATAYTVTVSDPLPDGLSFVAATPTPAAVVRQSLSGTSRNWVSASRQRSTSSCVWTSKRRLHS